MEQSPAGLRVWDFLQPLGVAHLPQTHLFSLQQPAPPAPSAPFACIYFKFYPSSSWKRTATSLEKIGPRIFWKKKPHPPEQTKTPSVFFFVYTSYGSFRSGALQHWYELPPA